jgi:radical SAM superfamily enzyme YgiQ (UPF0313 family)
VEFASFSRNRCFDYFVIGEGEITMLELVTALEKRTALETVRGLGFRKNGRVIKTDPRPRLTDLDQLPFPAFHLLDDITAYHPSPLGYRKRPFFPVVSSRGCPFHCYFCSTIWGHRWAGHSAHYVVDLVEYLVKRFGAREIWFAEDTFVIKKKRVMDICRGILERKLDIAWTCMGSIHTLDAEMLAIMKKAGCWQIQLGLEAGNDEVLKFVGKKTTTHMIREKVALIHASGILPRGYFILDHLVDTRATMAETIQFAKSLPLYSADFHLLQLPFGSRAREIAHQFGTVDYSPDLLTGYSSQGLGFVPKGMTVDFLLKTQRNAHLTFFLRPRQIMHLLRTISSAEDLRRIMLILWAGLQTVLPAKR